MEQPHRADTARLLGSAIGAGLGSFGGAATGHREPLILSQLHDSSVHMASGKGITILATSAKKASNPR
jgi:hypothetical protein